MAGANLSILMDHANAGLGTSRRHDAPTQAERDFVANKRRLRASWQAIAGMLGRSVEDTRRWHDGPAIAAESPAEAPSPAPASRAPVVRRLEPLSKGKQVSDPLLMRGRLAATLKAIGDGADTVVAIANAIGVTDSGARTPIVSLQNRQFVRIVGVRGAKAANVYALTNAGREALAKIEAAE